MALKPCKVCGTLNAEGVDTCLSCGHDPERSKRPVIFRYIAITVVVCLAIPLISGLWNWILWHIQPKTPKPKPSQVSLVLNPQTYPYHSSDRLLVSLDYSN